MSRLAHATIFIDQHKDLALLEEDVVRFVMKPMTDEQDGKICRCRMVAIECLAFGDMDGFGKNKVPDGVAKSAWVSACTLDSQSHQLAHSLCW